MQRLSPIRRWHARLKQEGANDIISSANDSFSFTILRGRVRTRHAELDAMCEKEGARAGLIRLNGFNIANSRPFM
jgi:hypothetical protein